MSIFSTYDIVCGVVLVNLGFIELSEISDGFSTSLVSRIIIGMTKKVFENISIWV